MNNRELNLNRSAGPLYLQIKDILLEDIKKGIYKMNDTIPTEKELQEAFNVSRMTIRLAINELVAEGYVLKERSKGTRVIQPKIIENLNEITNFNREMKALGINYVLYSTEMKIINANKQISEGLSVEMGSEVFALHRVYYVDKEPLVSITSYLPIRLNLSLDEEVYQGSLYEVLKNDKSILISRTDESIEVAFANKQISEDLGVPQGSAVLLRERQSYDQSLQKVEFVQSFYRPEKYKYSVTHSRKDVNI